MKQSGPRQSNNVVQAVIDVGAQREQIRCDLRFVFTPLADKGVRREFTLDNYGDRPYRPIVEQLLIALWETSAALDSDTVQTKVFQLRRFFAYLDERSSPLAPRVSPVRLSDLSFELIRGYEHWMYDQPVTEKSKVEFRLEQLQQHLESSPLPVNRLNLQPTASLATLERDLGFAAGYISRHPQLMNAVKKAASKQGLAIKKTCTVQWDRPKVSGQRLLSQKTVEESYITLSHLLRFIWKTSPHLFSNCFELPQFSSLKNQRRQLGTRSLSPSESDLIRGTCLTAVRQIKSRILHLGPQRAAYGRPLPSPGESATDWGKDTDNLLAYLSRYAPGEVIGQGNKEVRHREFRTAVIKCRERPAEIAWRLAPNRLDLAPFIIIMGLHEHAPINLEGLMTLHIEPEDPTKHCVRASPTPRHKRIYFGKPRAGMDQDYVDVPARSELDLPGLIETLVKLTDTVRPHAKSADRYSPWLYLSEKRGVLAVKPSDVSNNLLRQFVVTHDVRIEGALLLGINFRRLRPTSISEVSFSHGIEEARRRAAQANPIQTQLYVNNPTNEPRLREIALTAQSKAIASCQTGFADRPPKSEVEEIVAEFDVSYGAAMELLTGRRDKLFSACAGDKNGRGPAPKGKVCGQYEACLFCINCVILARHLPRLIAYQSHWLALAAEMPEDTWEEAHALNCAVVDEHLKKFGVEIVEAARDKAKTLLIPIASWRFKRR